jgi:hypothetical protein
MTRRTLLALLIASIGLGVGCSKQQEDPARTAYREIRQQMIDADTTAETIELAAGYLAEYPDTDYTGFLAEMVIDHYAGTEGRPEKAYRIVNDALQRVESADMRYELELQLAPLARELGRPVDLGAIIGRLTATRELEYSDHIAAVEAAVAVEDWALAESHAISAQGFATEEAFRADYPDRDLSDDRVTRQTRGRKVETLAHRGWAASNQGRIDEGLVLFEEAEPFRNNDYMGVSITPLDRYWGQALMLAGDFEGAMDRLARDAVFGDTNAALPLMRQAWAAVNEDDGDFDEYLWSTRQSLAKRVDDFTLPDYEGVDHTLSSFNGKVVLLAFWFPT